MHYTNFKIKSKAVKGSLILLLFVLIGCNGNINTKINVRFDKSVSFSKKKFGIGAFNMYFIKNDTGYIVNYDKITKDIRFVDLVTKKIELFPIEKSLNFRMIKVVSKDSIFLISRKDSRIILLDSKGKVRNVFPVHIFEKGVVQKIVAITPEWVSLSKGVIYINSYPSYMNRRIPYHKNHFNISINLKNKVVAMIPLTYPKIYTKERWWGGIGNKITHCVNNKNEIVYLFAMCDSLYVWDEKKVESYFVKRSNYLVDFPPDQFDNSKSMNSRYVIEYQRKNARYSSIKFDNRLKVYYRVVAHSQELKNKLGINNLNYDRSWSIQIIDTNFSVLNEIYFKSGKYNYTDFLITNEGFCVSNDISNMQDTIKWDFYSVERL